MKAIWNKTVLADSSETIQIEGNHYFPPNSINKSFFNSSETTSTCPWKGKASYFNINVDGKTNKDAAWVYKNPKEKASEIKDYIAFWKGVEITD